jgi:hypothetical protein
MKKFFALALIAAAGSANADILDVNIGTWQAVGGYTNPGNTSVTIALPAGTQITNIEWIDLTFTAQGASWVSELVLSVNDSVAGTGGFWDFNPGVGNDAPGTYGPLSGTFANPGLFSSGPFTMATNSLYIESYDSFNDAGTDAIVANGTLRVTYTPIPAPGAAALLGLGGLVVARRRR